MDKKPWVGHWWWCNSDGSTAVVKQDGALLTPKRFDMAKAETGWVFISGSSPFKDVGFFSPGNFGKVAQKIPIENIPFPPVEYLDEGTHEFELTENSYILYD